MVERQPGRPTEQEFIGAASRLDANQYPDRWTSSRIAHVLAAAGSVFTFKPVPEYRINLMKHDLKVIKAEQSYAGYVVGEEEIATFAAKQLARYKASK